MMNIKKWADSMWWKCARDIKIIKKNTFQWQNHEVSISKWYRCALEIKNSIYQLLRHHSLGKKKGMENWSISIDIISKKKKNLLHVLSHTEIIILAGQHIFLMDRQAKTVERIH